MISNDGNVGIGTITPDELLEVDGNAHIAGDLFVDGEIEGDMALQAQPFCHLVPDPVQLSVDAHLLI